MRDTRHDRPRRRRGRDHDRDLRRRPRARPRPIYTRSATTGPSTASTRRRAACIVAIDDQSRGHRAGRRHLLRGAARPRRRRSARPDRRRRPGDDVRLRVHGDRGADAAPDHARAPHLPSGSRRGAEGADVLPYLRPDGKSQVTVRYEVDEHGHPAAGRDRARPRLDAAPGRPRRRRADQARRDRARALPDPSARALRRAAVRTSATSCSSTRPASSSRVARWATPV